MSSKDQAANLLGATALAIADHTSAVAAHAVGQSESGAAALSALRQFLEPASLDRLREVLGLTPSGAVRLVDRLADAGLVVRGPGADGRTRAVSLTARGRRLADRIRTARLQALTSMLQPLTPAESDTLHELLGKLMSGIVEGKDGGAWLCRLCDLDACGRADGLCPTAVAAAAKYGAP